MSRFVSILAALSLSLPCSAQCLDWDERFYLTGTSDPVHTMATFDDGTGTALYLAGKPLVAATVNVSAIVKWDGATWTPLGSGVNDDVNALAVYDDGFGPELYAGGEFTLAGGGSANRIAKWDGSTWSPLGTGVTGGSNEVRALAVFDDGTGSALYVGGDFTTAGGVGANRIARWNGTSWSSVSSGFDGLVSALFTFDDGTGSALYAGGFFATAGGNAAARIAKWNGTRWSALGSGMSGGPVYSLGAYDDGSGPALFAGGGFTTAGGSSANRIAKWNGTSWAALGTGLQGSGTLTAALALRAFDDGSGPALFTVGFFLTAGGLTSNGAAKWNGTSWSPLSTGMNNQNVLALAEFDAGFGPMLYASGDFTVAGGVGALHVARWDGANWTALSTGLGPAGRTVDLPITDSASALTTMDDGSGEVLCLGGTFMQVGGTPASNVATWNGTSWSALGGGITGALVDNVPLNPTPYVRVNALTPHDDGTGYALFAAGNFSMADGASATRIAKWNGTSWSPLGSGMNALVNTIAAFDDGSGPALYAGGYFTTAGGTGANRIAKWNGTSWSALGSGVDGFVAALEVFDDGTGPALYAAGGFITAGGNMAARVARWNGTSWSAVGVGIMQSVYALEVYDDGSGAALYAGGDFSMFVGGANAPRVARWNGASWSAVGTGVFTGVRSLAVFDDGSTSGLYAGGTFAFTGGLVSAKGIAKWDGATWSPLGVGIGATEREVRALASYDDGDDGAPDLYAAGIFTSAGGSATSNFAQWRGCPPGTAYCFGDGLDPLVTALCPCGNFGEPGHGCANSTFPSGAKLRASGKTNPNTVLFRMTDVRNNTLATGFRNTGTNAGGSVFGDGVRCQSGTLIRFGSHNTGTMGDAPNTWTVGADTVSPGLTRYYAVQYRNSVPVFCPPETFNISNGYVITW